MKTVHVVAAVIFGSDKRQILIARRPKHLHQGGLWEFPGGKIEPEETPQHALVRELREEIDITITKFERLLEVSHAYKDKSVLLDFWAIYRFEGKPHGLEGQEVRWVKIEDVGDYEFPDANKPVLEWLLRENRQLVFIFRVPSGIQLRAINRR